MKNCRFKLGQICRKHLRGRSIIGKLTSFLKGKWISRTSLYSFRMREKIDQSNSKSFAKFTREHMCHQLSFFKKKLQVALVAASGINFYIKVRASVESSTPGNLLFCDNSPFFANFFILVHGNSKFLLEISNFRNPKPS